MNIFKKTLQYILPHKIISKIALTCAKNEITAIKNFLISYFIKRHNVNMNEAIEKNPFAYKSFNDFFTRRLTADARPINDADIVMPADGILAQYGNLKDGVMIQAKGFDYSVNDLLGYSEHNFANGSFATVYLAPHNYHRVHMPVTGVLNKMNYISGKLFSVSIATTNSIPNIFTKNERVVAIFDTEQYGQVALVLVGAMIVGGISTVWDGQICPPHNKKSFTKDYQGKNIKINKGDEAGLFTLGSTAIVVTEKGNINFSNFNELTMVNMGNILASYN